MKTLFNENWKFAKTPAGSADDEWSFEFSPVHIPHDWLIYNTENLYESSYGRYIKTYNFGNVKDKSFRIYFEGVYMNSIVFVNRQKAFDWKYGYSSFEADITAFLRDGENEIAVIGNEASGMTEEIKLICDRLITIPMSGRAESLNAAAAAGIVMWEMCR